MKENSFIRYFIQPNLLEYPILRILFINQILSDINQSGKAPNGIGGHRGHKNDTNWTISLHW